MSDERNKGVGPSGERSKGVGPSGERNADDERDDVEAHGAVGPWGKGERNADDDGGDDVEAHIKTTQLGG